jgi:hypothetical protein
VSRGRLPHLRTLSRVRVVVEPNYALSTIQLTVRPKGWRTKLINATIQCSDFGQLDDALTILSAMARLAEFDPPPVRGKKKPRRRTA